MGRVHPTPGRIVHNCPMIDGFVKVQVDRVQEGCGSTRLLLESCIPGEVECLEDAKGCFIQWPLKLIKIINEGCPQIVEPSHHSTTTLYRPQFQETFAHQQQTIPDKRNEYQIYSYALQDEEAFNNLIADKSFLIMQLSMFLYINLPSLFMLINLPSLLLFQKLQKKKQKY